MKGDSVSGRVKRVNYDLMTFRNKSFSKEPPERHLDQFLSGGQKLTNIPNHRNNVDVYIYIYIDPLRYLFQSKF